MLETMMAENTKGWKMNRDEAEEYLYCALDIGQLLLASGAEVNRVEDTISRVMAAASVPKVEVFSITSNITVTAHLDGFQTLTQMRRVYAIHTNMRRIEELNQLSRDICAKKLKPEEIRDRIEHIQEEKPANSRLLPVGYAIVSGAFALFFGGDLNDFAASVLIGFLLCYIERLISRFTDNILMTALIWSTIGGFLAQLTVLSGLGHHADLISIGNIMLFIPGIAFTNSIRDMFVGDTITGLIRFMESILLAGIIAVGFTLAGRILTGLL